MAHTSGEPATATTPAESGWGAPPATAWYAVAVLTLAYTFSYIDRSILSLLVGPIKADLGIGDTAFSLLQGLAFALFYTILGIPIAAVADRASRRWVIAIGVFVWSLATALGGLARSFWELFAARVMVGVGEAALSPAAYSMITDLFPRKRLGVAMGTYAIGVFLGIGLAFIIGGSIAQAAASMPPIDVPVIGLMAGWQLTLIAVGLPGVLVAALVLTITEPARRQSANKLATGQASTADVIRHVRANAATFTCHVGGFAMLTLLFNGIMAWAPEFFIRSYETPRGEIGRSLGVIVLVFGSLGIWSGGVVSDWLSRGGRHEGPIRAGLIAAVLVIPCALGATLAGDETISLILFCPLLYFASFPFGPAAAALQIASPPAMRARISAVYLFFVNLTGIGLGGTITAAVTEYVLRDEAQLGLAMAMVAGVGGVLAVLLLAMGQAPFRRTVTTLEAAG